MRQLFDVYSTCAGNWQKSSLILTHRRSVSAASVGRFVWRTFDAVAKEKLEFNIWAHTAILVHGRAFM